MTKPAISASDSIMPPPLLIVALFKFESGDNVELLDEMEDLERLEN